MLFRAFLDQKAIQTLVHTAPQVLPHIDSTKISLANTTPTAKRLVCAKVKTHDPNYQKYIIQYMLAHISRASYRIYILTVLSGTY